jgi:hypothetical protein
MADWSGIRAALATQMGLAEGIRESTSTKLSGFGMLPTVKVEGITSLEIYDQRGGRGAGFEYRIARIAGKLLVATAADIGRTQVTTETYVERLFVAARTGLKLGYPTVVEDSWLDSARVGQQEYGGKQLHGADLEWIVKVMETVERTS